MTCPWLPGHPASDRESTCGSDQHAYSPGLLTCDCRLQTCLYGAAIATSFVVLRGCAVALPYNDPVHCKLSTRMKAARRAAPRASSKQAENTTTNRVQCTHATAATTSFVVHHMWTETLAVGICPCIPRPHIWEVMLVVLQVMLMTSK